MKKLTQREVECLLDERLHGEYSIIDTYKSYHTKMRVKHNIDGCGFEYETSAAELFSGKGKCPVCNITHRMTDEIFVLKIKRQWPDFFKNFELISNYIGYDSPIKIKHLCCGNIYNSTPRDLLRTANTCNKCNPRRYIKIPRAELMERLDNELDEEYSILNRDEIMSFDDPIQIKHICGETYTAQFKDYKLTCPVCNRVKVITPELFEKKFKFTDMYKSGEYEIVNSNKDDTILCHVPCGMTFHTDYTHVLYFEGGCPKCNTGNRFRKNTHDEFLASLPPNFLDEYEILSEYAGYYKNIRIQHKKCGTIQETTPYLIQCRELTVCDHCFSDKRTVYHGELAIHTILDERGIQYEPQYRFRDCRGTRVYPFDIGITTDGNLSMLIEYDGEQHFMPIEFFGGHPEFLKRVQCDRYKNQYCLEHHIPLLRIPYTEFYNIKEIINTVLDLGLNSAYQLLSDRVWFISGQYDDMPEIYRNIGTK